VQFAQFALVLGLHVCDLLVERTTHPRHSRTYSFVSIQPLSVSSLDVG
jgi:hypothetical protein